jgi:hypothetical protein
MQLKHHSLLIFVGLAVIRADNKEGRGREGRERDMIDKFDQLKGFLHTAKDSLEENHSQSYLKWETVG